MFDISWSELLILGVVTLIFVGPKELPRFLNTLGRYAGMVRRHANEFRRVFDEAMREAELQELKKSVDEVRDGMASSFRDIKTGTTSAMSTEPGKPPASSASAAPAAKPAEASAAEAAGERMPDAFTPEAAARATPAPQQVSFLHASPSEAPKPEPVPAEESKVGGNS